MATQWPSEFDMFRKLHQPDVLDKLEVFTPKELGRNFLLHMSKNSELKMMTPYVSTRTVRAEDRSVPRVCCSPTIAACILGYNGAMTDFFKGSDSTDGHGKTEVEWRGGWYIYAIPFKHALIADKSLLPAVEETLERWLVAYDEASRKYKPIPVGKLFYRSMIFTNADDERKDTVELVVEITTDKVAIPFLEDLKLGKGYWRLMIDGMHQHGDHAKVTVAEQKQLSKEEYEALKTPTADLLSYKEPLWLRW